ncbi:hypothetical protein, partial [Eggerthella lenta]|uniref:hypothetical protein n=1 Tax=Eggerthella lenta TaxID=84112 RepID=UPI003F738CE7
REEEVGTGNATLVAYEKKPVRVDGFEHYRAIVQIYSGVSVPYLDAAGKYYGAMNINSPFEKWYNGSEPAGYVSKMLNVGLVTWSRTPSPAATPCTNCVLP